MTPEEIEAEARLLHEQGPQPVHKSARWENLPECFEEIWRMRVTLLGERADLS